MEYQCKNHVHILHLRSIFPTPKVHISLQKQLNVDDKIKIKSCKHPPPKVHISLQKQLKIDDKIKIKSR